MLANYRIAILVTLSVFITFTPIFAAGNLTLGSFELLSKTRVGRTDYAYTYSATITNDGLEVKDVAAEVTSNSSFTTIVDGSLSFGDLGSGETKTSIDTFTIRQNRRHAVNWDDLVWEIGFEPMDTHTLEIGITGGTLEFPNGVILDVPPGAVSALTTITLTDLPMDEINAILSSRKYASYPKRYIGGFSAEPDLVFNLPIKAIVPVLPLEPYEIPIQIEVDLDSQTYQVAEASLKHLASQQAMEIEISHFSGIGVAAVDSLDPNRIDDLCRDPLFAPHLRICEELDDLQPAYCLLKKNDRPDDAFCCREFEATHIVSEVDKTTISSDATEECQVSVSTVISTYPACELEDGSPAPPFEHSISDVSKGCKLEELADYFLQAYEGENGFLELLKGVTSCADPEMEQVVREIVRLESLFLSLNEILSFSARDCVYQNQMLDELPSYRQCTSFSDFAKAAKISLKNRIEEMSMIFNSSCKWDSFAEHKYLECIGLGLYFGPNQYVLKDFNQYDMRFGETLAENKTCGIYSLSIDPDRDHLLVGDSTLLTAIARDKDGNILPNREMSWGKDKSNAVTMTANPQAARITGNSDGSSLVQTMDEMSRQAIVHINMPITGNLATIPIIDGLNTNTSFITVGGSVELSPSEITLIPPETMTIEATYYDPYGKVSAPAGYVWRSSNEDIVRVEGGGFLGSQGSLMPAGIGIATITAIELDTGITGKAKVMVGAKMNMTPPEICLQVFESAELSAVVENLEGAPVPGVGPYAVTWYSPNNRVASVSIDGIVLAQSPGEVQIEATYKNATGFASVFVPELDPINFMVTPVYTPPTFLLDGVLYHGRGFYINDNRRVVNKWEEFIRAALGCDLFDELPAEAAYTELSVNNDGLFGYTLIDYVDFNRYAYIFDANRCEVTEIPVESSMPHFSVEIDDINDKGQVVGSIRHNHPDTDKDRGYVYDYESGGVELLPMGGPYPYRINNKREILCLGEGYFIYSDGEFTSLPSSIPGQDPFLHYHYGDLNDQGVIVGQYGYRTYGPNSGGEEEWSRGFIRYDGEFMVWDLPFPDTLPEMDHWFLTNINNHNDILVQHYNRYDRRPNFERSVIHLCPLE